MTEHKQVVTSTAEGWIRREQERLWNDLGNDINGAINGAWSIASGNRVCRIIEAARIVGPSDPNSIGWSLLASGVYEAVLAAGGIEAPEIPWDDPRWVRMTEYGTRQELAERFAATLRAIADDAAWIVQQTSADDESEADRG